MIDTQIALNCAIRLFSPLKRPTSLSILHAQFVVAGSIQNMKLDGQVALVTGSAHRVGKAIALALAQAGADIVVHYGGSAEAAVQTAAEIEMLDRRTLVEQA